MLNAITQMVIEMKGRGEYLYFDTPIQVKTSPHTPETAIWAVCVSPANDVFVLCTDHQWYPVEENEKDAQVIESLFQRLRYMKSQMAPKPTKEVVG